MKKRMLSVETDSSGFITVNINSSSLSLLQECPRKAHYRLDLDLVREDVEDSAALVFGKAIHAALDLYYSTPIADRPSCEQACLDLFLVKADSLADFPDETKRTPDVGEKILSAYFKQYSNDNYMVLIDKDGPVVEREFSFELYRSQEMVINYFGTIDLVMVDVSTGQVFVVDHKTTSVLGSQFLNRHNPNHQFTGYLMGAKRCLGLDTNSFMINGIQVAKTKQSFLRQITSRCDDDYQEFAFVVRDAVLRWLELKRLGFYPQHAPGPCANYSGCQYLELCQTPNSLKETVMRNTWKK